MQLKVSCHTTQIESYVDHYESTGFQLLHKDIDADVATLTFQGYSAAHAAEASFWDSGSQAFLEFSDGTTSPLYVRRSRWMDD